MTKFSTFEDTICALATPQGESAIAVIRLSGQQAISIADQLFLPKGLADAGGYSLHHGNLTYKNETIDEVLASVFRSPHSYTGEDMVEFSCHGSGYLQQRILSLLIQQGARPALPGEFTQRAYLNGKLDLSQAEAVADLIACRSEAARQIAVKQLKGGISKTIEKLRKRLSEFASLLELELDFSEEEVEFADRYSLIKTLGEIKAITTRLIKSFEVGSAMKNGVPIVITGRPNAGKSTLLNAIIEEERAIVSHIPGTTRDSIEESVHIDGLLYRFIDTAGIRLPGDHLEHLGIERTKDQIRRSSVALYLFDISNCTEKDVMEDMDYIRKEAGDARFPVIAVGNKMDLASSEQQQAAREIKPAALISAFERSDIDAVLQLVKEEGKRICASNSDVLISNTRHLHAFMAADEALASALQGLEHEIGEELIAEDIRLTLFHLGSITGAVSSEDILNDIFSRFCIGK